MYVCTYVCMYVCVYVCICMYVCMYVCMYGIVLLFTEITSIMTSVIESSHLSRKFTLSKKAIRTLEKCKRINVSNLLRTHFFINYNNYNESVDLFIIIVGELFLFIATFHSAWEYSAV